MQPQTAIACLRRIAPGNAAGRTTLMAKNDPRAFGVLLRRHRLNAGLTQEGLAEGAGLSVRGISDLERGVNKTPYVATILRLSDALQLSDEQRTELEAAISRHRGPSIQRHVLQLPEQFTSLLGREKDVAAAVHLLRWEGRRLLTLTGPGGVGKTRLAIQVATTTAADFESGAVFVPLEEVADAGGVESAIAAAIQLRDEPGRSLHESLIAFLEDREMLLVFDGFEHLMDAAPLPARFLVACPRLKILVTSRSPLHLSGEQELDVKSLPVPAAGESTDLARLAGFPSVALFVQRARKVQPTFTLTTQTGPVIADICRRLDGLPLAIELAAARIKTLSPRALLQALEHRLNVLIGGPRDSQPRQQTMRDTIAWSYDLLDDDGRTLFRSLSIFNSTFGVETAGAVAPQLGDSWSDALGEIAVLADCSLLAAHESSEDEPRFSMLETVREYGLEQLDHLGEGEAVRQRLAHYGLGLAERAEVELHGAHQAEWMARLEREHATLLLVLRWAQATAELCIGLQIAGALWRFWYSHGYLSEGRRQLEGLLTAMGDSDSVPVPVVAKAVRGAAVLAAVQGDYARAEILGDRGLHLYRQLGDVRGEAAMLVILGSVGHYTGDYATAWTRYGESLALFRSAGDEPSISVALNNLANIAKEQGHTVEAIALYEQSLTIKRRLGDSRGIAIALNNLGTMALAQGQYDRAATFGEEALVLLRDLGDKDVTAAIDTVARAALERGEIRRAADLYDEGLKVSYAAGDRELVAFCLEGTGRVAAAEGKMERAGTLYGAGEALRIAVGAPLSPSEVPQHNLSVEVTRTALGEQAFSLAWERGVQMDLDAAIEFAGETAASIQDRA
jgi:predicted ATPase/DNA-binding XRE family transcriptional regulator